MPNGNDLGEAKIKRDFTSCKMLRLNNAQVNLELCSA